MKLHAGEVDIDARLVRRLVQEQFPALQGPIREVRSTGTVNAIYRLGERHYARLPRVAHWAQDLEKEWTWLPRLAPRLSLQSRIPVALGEPTDDVPVHLGDLRVDRGRAVRRRGRARDRGLGARAAFVAELRAIGPLEGAPRGGRRPLDEPRRRDPRGARGRGARRVGTSARGAGLGRRERRSWIHTDLLRPNILVHDGRVQR